MKILKDARKWFAMEITTGSHLPASWCACVGWGWGGHKPKAKAARLPTPSRRQMWESPLLVGSSSGRTPWTMDKGRLSTNPAGEPRTGPADRVDHRAVLCFAGLLAASLSSTQQMLWAFTTLPPRQSPDNPNCLQMLSYVPGGRKHP